MNFSKRKIFFLLIFVLIILSLPSFYRHVRWFVSGEVESVVIGGRWDLVILNALFFLAFLIPLSFRKRVEWKSMSIYTAFIVSLFIEMYGIPLTIYLSSATLFGGASSPPTQQAILSFTVFGQTLSMTLWKLVGAAVSIIGMIVIILGWVTLYRNRQKNELVTIGIYNYSRHPQYLGIVLVAVGWFIHWPSILTFIMLPVLLYFYYKLALAEEKEVMQGLEEPNIYEDYMSETPRFL